MAVTDFLTYWSLLISYSIFIFILFFNKLVPFYIFLTAACLLSSTSIIGTIFITGPIMSKEESAEDKLILLYKDILVHIGPILLFLLLFKTLFNRVNTLHISSLSKIREIPSIFFIISIVIFIIIGLSYFGVINPITKSVYKDTNSYASIILLICVYSSIYQIYFTQVKYLLR